MFGGNSGGGAHAGGYGGGGECGEGYGLGYVAGRQYAHFAPHQNVWHHHAAAAAAAHHDSYAGGGGVGSVGSVGAVGGGLYGQNVVMGSWCAPYDALQRPPAYVSAAETRPVLYELRVAQHDAVATQQRRRARLQRVWTLLQAARHQQAVSDEKRRHPDEEAKAEEVWKWHETKQRIIQEGRSQFTRRRREQAEHIGSGTTSYIVDAAHDQAPRLARHAGDLAALALPPWPHGNPRPRPQPRPRAVPAGAAHGAFPAQRVALQHQERAQHGQRVRGLCGPRRTALPLTATLLACLTVRSGQQRGGGRKRVPSPTQRDGPRQAHGLHVAAPTACCLQLANNGHSCQTLATDDELRPQFQYSGHCCRIKATNDVLRFSVYWPVADQWSKLPSTCHALRDRIPFS